MSSLSALRWVQPLLPMTFWRAETLSSHSATAAASRRCAYGVLWASSPTSEGARSLIFLHLPPPGLNSAPASISPGVCARRSVCCFLLACLRQRSVHVHTLQLR